MSQILDVPAGHFIGVSQESLPRFHDLCYVPQGDYEEAQKAAVAVVRWIEKGFRNRTLNGPLLGSLNAIQSPYAEPVMVPPPKGKRWSFSGLYIWEQAFGTPYRRLLYLTDVRQYAGIKPFTWDKEAILRRLVSDWINSQPKERLTLLAESEVFT